MSLSETVNPLTDEQDTKDRPSLDKLMQQAAAAAAHRPTAAVVAGAAATAGVQEWGEAGSRGGGGRGGLSDALMEMPVLDNPIVGQVSVKK